ncbi:host cell factor-like isoform X3 [Maniola hyperantus]|uniref:host cell factor-like isoform X3 n=1 Tax=Aphantopus hyperantus TaxID=2795564 RepID=UPI00156A4C41|nr:host cell factor-like isoform X1 [Maniola hyperantus]
MESDSALHGDIPDGAEMSPLVENQAETVGEISDNNIAPDEVEDAQTTEDAATNGAAPTSSSDVLDLEPIADLPENEEQHAEPDADEEMDIDETTPRTAGDESAYIGDNCLSTPAETEDNSLQDDNQLEPLLKEQGLEEGEGVEGAQEESPDQSISSAMPIEGDGAPLIQDEESSTMDEDMGGGEGVASSDDVNDISSAAQEALSTGISSSTTEGGADISSSGQSEAALISSTANGPAVLHSFSELPQAQPTNEFNDADTSEMEGAADTMPSVSESMPLLTMTANGSTLLSPNLLQGMFQSEEGGAASVSSSGAEGGGGEAAGAGEGDGAVSSSGPAAAGANGAPPIPPTDAAHALATLASAALHHQHEQAEPEDQKPVNEEDLWYTVGFVKGTTFTVQNYIADPNVDISNLSLDSLPDFASLATTPLEHGTAYKFRIAAINSCGRGEFSEESAFKTCLPGFPGAPSAIKISKSVEGAHLSWEPPQVAAEGIFEYSVYLAVRSNTQPKEASKSQLAFVRVYCGKANTCVVPQSSLSAAHVDSSTKPAIIFRIAARNDKGYGPATQVRWLQDIKSTGVKRAGDGRLPGASPSKQPKQLLH